VAINLNVDLKKIFAGLSGLPAQMFHPSGSVIGVDVGSSAIKVVQIKKERGRAVLETYGSIALGPYGDLAMGAVTNLPAEKISAALVSLFEEAGVSARSAAVSIPSSLGLVFLLELPAQVKESEFKNVVPTEARKFVPVPITEVLLDWFAVPKKETEIEGEESKTPTEILAVAVPKDALSRLTEIANGAALESPIFEHEVFSEMRAVLSHQIAPVLIVDFGAGKTRAAIVERGIVRVFHSINRGGSDITNSLSAALGLSFAEAEEIKKKEGLKSKDPNVANTINLGADFILGEVANIVLNFQKKYNRGVSEVILTGGGANLAGMVLKTKETLRLEASVGSAFEKTEAPAFLAKTLQEAGPEFAVAVGLALKKI
jgi:type IV pilus assembly protein PilM